MGRLRTGLQVLCPPEEKGIKSALLQDLIKETVDLLVNVEPFLLNINEEVARKGNKTYLLNDFSAFPSVLKNIEQISILEDKLDAQKFKISQQLGLSNLKYITASNEEFLIEVKCNQIKFVPHSWRKISETKQTIRYRSLEIDSLFKELSKLREDLAKDCEAAWLGFLANFNSYYFSHKKAIRNIAILDILLSFVKVARLEGYFRPTVIDSDEVIISIENGRHPIIPLLFTGDDQFVANDTNLKSNEQRCMILSGPNMGGKSCYIRQVALIVIMAHIGSYVPASSATISILDAVYTRMGGRDDLFKGKSMLMTELEEASFIIHKATNHSLVLMDELGHGTSSCDGTSLAIATLHHLLKEVKCLTLFVTHYPAVMALQHKFSGIAQNYHMSFLINDQKDESVKVLTLLYKVTHGSAGCSYGLNVARLANVPLKILTVAGEKADILELWTDTRKHDWQEFKNIWHTHIGLLKDKLERDIKSIVE
ncbi:hypothetical protein L9F63_021234 [Diploptera punctata]|uniref:DNA mismatch repair proteins mutS family domain-containing protein n=1 Tax=Diploptera punctata TaxID=6984 RepID=A0AAD8EC46_DIPPU|nr:hypothetical protein L9F63_021234 [Diploptera punctata]